jgi:photosystem II stability/assembly factor-like uncharacterized protein
MSARRPIALLTISLMLASPLAAQTPKGKGTPPPMATETLLKGLKARSIGPAVMGGRISDIAIDPHNPAVFYVGFATSGVWKSSNYGVTLSPIFDDEPAQSIGAVAVAPSNDKIVWVGTGEGNDRNSSGWGVGMFKSTDAGGTWKFAGLKTSRTIRRIVIHPTNPDIVFAAAGGSLWADGGERGLYRTTDGGATWQLVLSAKAPDNAVAGCSDVVMDPDNPDVLYAALYARQRKPWAFLYGVSATAKGADVGGIFKSTDGGATWTKMTSGLPTETGRIGLAVARSKPNTVMAIVQSDEGGTSDIDQNHSRRGGIFRSEDAGATWVRVNSFDPRPFYFSRIEIDPANDQRVYVVAWNVYLSEDGGKTFREDKSAHVHSDVHAIAIQAGSTLPPPMTAPGDSTPKATPPVSQRILIGTDGGLYQSFDAASSWQFLNSVPAGQYYRIALDSSTPYRIAGGLQDNSNWVGPSRTDTKEGIRNADWTMIGGGDGFYTVFDPADSNIIFAESQGGEVHRFNARTGEMRNFQPKPAEGSAAFRFHWTAPLIGSLHDKDVLYLGGNRVFKITNHGETFEIISPDLSHNEPDKTNTLGSAAENYAVVYALAESPLKAGRLFAGTDDGRLWVTSDEGKEWTELTGKLPKEVRGRWVARIEPSHYDADAGYVVFSSYRSGDDTPYVYRFTKLGGSWTRVTGDLPDADPAIVLREDPVNPKLLYLGTEFGLYITLDGGAHWVRFGGLPQVRVDDIQLQAREGDVVIATHGRSLYVLDDSRPLREFTPQVADSAAHLFSVRAAHGRFLLPGWVESGGTGYFQGDNPPEGALLTVWVKEYTGDKFTVTIADSTGRDVAKFEAPAVPGFTRLNWDLRVQKAYRFDYMGDEGNRFVPPGTYTATLSLKDVHVKQKFAVTVEPGLRTFGTYRE